MGVSHPNAAQAWVKAVAIHMGSRLGNDPVYAESAERLGRALPENGFKRIYYGDGVAGTMGVVARAAVAAGAEVYGVSLKFFNKAQGGVLPEVKSRVVKTMHQRMTHMRTNSHANVVLPGSYGTMEEGLEWLCAENGHVKPQLIVNTGGYWSGFLEFMERADSFGGKRSGLAQRFHAVATIDNAIEMLHEHNNRAAMPDSGLGVKARADSDYIVETQHALIMKPAPIDVMSRLMTRVVTYDVSNIPGQTVFKGKIIKPVIFANEDGYYDGIARQLQTIFNAGFSPPERRAFFHIAGGVDEAMDRAKMLDSLPPLQPGFLQVKHAEAHKSHVTVMGYRIEPESTGAPGPTA